LAWCQTYRASRAFVPPCTPPVMAGRQLSDQWCTARLNAAGTLAAQRRQDNRPVPRRKRKMTHFYSLSCGWLFFRLSAGDRGTDPPGAERAGEVMAPTFPPQGPFREGAARPVRQPGPGGPDRRPDAAGRILPWAVGRRTRAAGGGQAGSENSLRRTTSRDLPPRNASISSLAYPPASGWRSRWWFQRSRVLGIMGGPEPRG
jgi:hypothetical protein